MTSSTPKKTPSKRLASSPPSSHRSQKRSGVGLKSSPSSRAEKVPCVVIQNEKGQTTSEAVEPGTKAGGHFLGKELKRIVV